MASFRFRLETVLRLRLAERDDKRRELAEAHLADQEIQKRENALHQEMTSLKETHQQEARPGPMDVDRLMRVQRYEVELQMQSKQLAEARRMLAIEVERRQQVLTEADREVRVLERLREIHRARHLREEQRMENHFLDEVAGRTARETL